MLGEFDIIRDYFTRQPLRRDDVQMGIGDDGAVVQVPADRSLVLSTDGIHAGVHFPEDTSAEHIGHRALAVNLSDLAAMGAEPAWATLVLSLPEADAKWLEGFASGFFGLAERYDVALIGGDTIRGPLSATVAAYGLVPADQWISRAGAKAGQRIVISGTLGDAAAGLQLMRSTTGPGDEDRQWLIERFLKPEPRVSLGLWLRGHATAAIDLSDGLLADLGKLLDAAQVGADLAIDRLPLSAPLSATFSGPECEEFALYGGDDYEICFTCASGSDRELEAAAVGLGCRLTCIGEVTEGMGLELRNGGRTRRVRPRGYDHFKR